MRLLLVGWGRTGNDSGGWKNGFFCPQGKKGIPSRQSSVLGVEQNWTAIEQNWNCAGLGGKSVLFWCCFCGSSAESVFCSVETENAEAKKSEVTQAVMRALDGTDFIVDTF